MRTSAKPPNLLGGLGGWIWFAIIIVPLYYVVITSFKGPESFFSGNALAPPTDPTLENYELVLENDFARYFLCPCWPPISSDAGNWWPA